LPWTTAGSWFGLVPVTATVLLAVVLVVFGYLFASELTKGPFYYWLARGSTVARP